MQSDFCISLGRHTEKKGYHDSFKLELKENQMKLKFPQYLSPN